MFDFASRDDKRYTEKKNKTERARRKKEDIARVRGLVDLALSLDPRIKRIKQEEKDAREAKRRAGAPGAPAKKTKAQEEEEKKQAEAEKAAAEEAEKVRFGFSMFFLQGTWALMRVCFCRPPARRRRSRRRRRRMRRRRRVASSARRRRLVLLLRELRPARELACEREARWVGGCSPCGARGKCDGVAGTDTHSSRWG